MTMASLSAMLLLGIVITLVPLSESTYKLCCDPKCETPISHGRTQSRRTVREDRHLTYPAGAKVTIWAKHYNSQPDVWEAEMYGKWGLVYKNDIEESIIHCTVPQHWVPVNEITDVETGETKVETGETKVETGETRVETGETSIGTSETSVKADETFPSFDSTSILPTTTIIPFADDINDMKTVSYTNDNDEDDEGDTMESETSTKLPSLTDSLTTQFTDTESSKEDSAIYSTSTNFDTLFVSDTPIPSQSLHAHSSSNDLSDELKSQQFDSESQSVNVPSGDSMVSNDSLSQFWHEGHQFSKKEDVEEGHSHFLNEHQNGIDPHQKNHNSFQEEQPHQEEHTSLEEKPSQEEPSPWEEQPSSKEEWSPWEEQSSQDEQTPKDEPSSQEEQPPQEEQHSSQNEHTSSQKEGTPPQQEQPPFQEGHKSSHDEQFPSQEDHKSSHDEQSLSQEDHKSSHDEQSPSQEDDKSSHDEQSPSQEDHKSSQEEQSPSQTDLHNFQDELISSQTKHPSFQTEHLLSQKKNFSSQTEHLSSQTEHLLQTENLPSQTERSLSQELPPQMEHTDQQKEHSPSQDSEEQFSQHKEHTPSNIPSQTVLPSQNNILHSAREQEDYSSFPSRQEVQSPSPENVHEPSSVYTRFHESHHHSSLPEESPSIQSTNNVPSLMDSTSSQSLPKFVGWFLPVQVEDWLNSKVSDASIFGLCVSLIVIILPLFCSCCRIQRKASKTTKELKSMQGQRQNMETHMKKLSDEKNNLESLVKNLQAQLTDYQLKLENEKQGTWDLENVRMNLESEKKSLEGLYQSLQDDHNHSMKSFKLELQNAQEQIELLKNENNNYQLQITAYDAHLKEAILKTEESEAAKVQLEQDIYNLRQELEHLHIEHDKLLKEHGELSTEHSKVCDDFRSTQQQLEEANELVTEKNTENATLQECIQSLSVVDGQDASLQLEKIQAMLDTTKAQSDLRTISSERDQLQVELQSQTLLIDQLRTQKSSLEQEVSDLYSTKENILHQYQETQMKLKAITEYFEEKESHLHRKIGEEEIVRQRVESREAYAKERADLIEQEREKEREELKELRQQMGDIEKSLMQQVITNERRAEDALSQLRRTEQELRSANKEITMLKKQLVDIDDMRNRSHDRIGPPPPISGPVPPPPLSGPVPPGPPGPRGQLRPLMYGPRGPPPFPEIPLPRPPPFDRSSPFQPIEKETEKNKMYEKKAFVPSRPPPPGMESRDHPRPDYPSNSKRSPNSHKRGDPPPFDRPVFHSDRPPIPGDLGYYPYRPYPSRNYPPPPPFERRRPPSEPSYEAMCDARRPLSNPPLGAPGVSLSSSVRVPNEFSKPDSKLPPSQSLPLNMSPKDVRKSVPQ